jgi:hypothetical protein
MIQTLSMEDGCVVVTKACGEALLQNHASCDAFAGACRTFKQQMLVAKTCAIVSDNLSYAWVLKDQVFDRVWFVFLCKVHSFSLSK